MVGAIRREATTPIVILSGRYEEQEKVEALERGADDYVTKPFGVEELRARIRVALRRAAGPPGRVRAGYGRSDRPRRRAHELRLGDRRVDVTPREFEILRVLLTHRGRVVTKGRLLRAVSGEAYRTRTATCTSTSAACVASSTARPRRSPRDP